MMQLHPTLFLSQQELQTRKSHSDANILRKRFLLLQAYRARAGAAADPAGAYIAEHDSAAQRVGSSITSQSAAEVLAHSRLMNKTTTRDQNLVQTGRFRLAIFD